jgi:hypothetical protein
MIGEIRDEETASMAFRAAQTGHLVLILIRFQDELKYGRVEAWEDHGGSTGEQ